MADATETVRPSRFRRIVGAGHENGGPQTGASRVVRRRRAISYRRIAVCLSSANASARAVRVACALAGEHGATITALAAVEVPLEMPLEAVDATVEAAARDAVLTARAIADSYGVGAQGMILHARDGGEAIVAEVTARRAQVVVLAVDWLRGKRNMRLLPETADHVLKHAPCRVILIGSAAERGRSDPVFHAGRPRDYWPTGEFVDRIDGWGAIRR